VVALGSARFQPLETSEIISESEEEMRRFDEIDVGAAGS
jgi:hypothetical protein